MTTQEQKETKVAEQTVSCSAMKECAEKIKKHTQDMLSDPENADFYAEQIKLETEELRRRAARIAGGKQVYSEKTFANKVDVSVVKSVKGAYKLIITSNTQQIPASLLRWHGMEYDTEAGAIRRAKNLVVRLSSE